VDKVHDMMDDIAEQQDVAREISDAISNPVAFGADLDDEDLERELDELEQENFDKEIIGIPEPAPRRGDTEAARDGEHAYQEAGVPGGQDRGRAEYSSQECIQKQKRYVCSLPGRGPCSSNWPLGWARAKWLIALFLLRPRGPPN